MKLHSEYLRNIVLLKNLQKKYRKFQHFFSIMYHSLNENPKLYVQYVGNIRNSRNPLVHTGLYSLGAVVTVSFRSTLMRTNISTVYYLAYRYHT